MIPFYKVQQIRTWQDWEDMDLPRCNCRSRTSRVSPPRCFARRQPKFVTESMNSSAISRSSYDIYKYSRTWYGDKERTSSTSGSIFTLGSILDTKSWIDLRILWSPGEFFLRVLVSSKARAFVSSVLLAICAGVPIFILAEPLAAASLLNVHT